MATGREVPKLFKAFRNFGKWVTAATRTALREDDFSYQQNLQVIGPGNIQTVAAPLLVNKVTNTLLTNDPNSLMSAKTWYVNIGGVDWQLVLTLDNTLWVASLSGATVVTEISTGVQISDVTQWSNSVALLIGPTGYFYWTGSGNIVPITAADSVILTVQLLSQMGLSGITGIFVAGETITGSTSHATAVVQSFFSPTVFFHTNVGIFVNGETVTGGSSGATGTIASLGPQTDLPGSGDVIRQGSPATATATLTAWNPAANTLQVHGPITGTFVVDGLVYDGAIGNLLIGVITAIDNSAPPESGNWIAVYAGRVWVATGRTVVFSGPNDYTAPSWDVAQGAGEFVIDDETLIGIITRLIVANGYLYIFGQTSIDIVSNVYVPSGATPPTPLFSRTNIDAINGTAFSYSIVPFGRLILFYNVHGIHALLGVDVQRISADIDGTIQQIDSNPPGLVSAGVGISNNILTACFLLSWFDPVLSAGQSRQTLLSFHDGRWFVHDPFNSTFPGATTDYLASVASAEIAGDPVALLARDFSFPPTSDASNSRISGTDLYSLFNGSGALQRTLQTALWDLGSSIHTKQAINYGIEGTVYDLNFSITATMDAQPGNSSLNSANFLPPTLQWYADAARTVLANWITATHTAATWVAPGYAFQYAGTQQYGKYLGMTLSGQTGRAVISGLNLEYDRRDATWKL